MAARGVKVITFMVQGRHFALPTHEVKEIIDTVDEVKRVCHGGEGLYGVLGFDGQLISVLNLACLLDLPGHEEAAMMLICKDREMLAPVAFLISGIKGMTFAEGDRLSPVEEDDAPCIEGYIPEAVDGKGGPAALLGLKRLLDDGAVKMVRDENIFDVSLME